MIAKGADGVLCRCLHSACSHVPSGLIFVPHRREEHSRAQSADVRRRERMPHPISRALILACLVLLSGRTLLALLPIGEARAAEAQVASLQAEEASRQIIDTGRSSMPARTQTAQARCPGGQIVFLTRECGCNGA